ncbi:MAG: protein translocase subunit SecD [Candidatus Calescibacterium sp.]|jgi:protein-export membrane protein SecD|nr:protein translocase subunit SecD [Candidatus Calescibacterium sp.]
MRIRLAIVVISAIVFGVIIWWKGIKLGLDLKGGSYFLLNVRQDIAVKKFTERIASEILSEYEKTYGEQTTEHPVRFEDTKIYVSASPDFIEKIKKDFPSFNYEGSAFFEDKEYHIFTLKEEEIKEIEEFAVNQALSTIRARVDEFGIAEPQIFRYGKSNIVVQLPGIQDPSQAKRIIGRTALLEFRIVDDENDFFATITPEEGIYKGTEIGAGGKTVSYLWVYEKDYEKLANFIKNLNPPPGRIIFIGKGEKGNIWRTYLLESISEITGEFLRNAVVRMNTITNEPYVLISFNSEGAKRFEKITGENVGKRLAIILDEKVFSAPVIREKISGGVATIEGRFTIEEAKELAAVLRAGALPAPVEFEEERTVGPSLGEDSIKKGIIASVTGAVLVALFMLSYYRISGFVAVIGVVITILFTLSILSLFGATLTLPGIAGLALTVGMAVDNNIIIFERIREELLRKQVIKPAVEAGHKLGMATIIDANLTTLIAALFIFQFGTGPVRGFALTLSIGILGAMYGAVFCSKTILDSLLQRRIFSI